MEFAIFAVPFLVLIASIWTAVTSEDRRRRIRYGIAAILAAAICFFLVGTVASFQHNDSYSRAADKLLEASVNALEGGRQAEVLREWKAMDQKFRQSYETRGNFREITEEAIKGMNTSEPR